MSTANSIALAAAEISLDELVQRLRDPSLTVVDVLPHESFVAGHIPGALSLPTGDVSTSAQQVLRKHDAEIAVYCASVTCGAAEKAAGLLRDLGYSHVRHFHEGLAGWESAGFPLEVGEGDGSARDVEDTHPASPETVSRSTSRAQVSAGGGRWGTAILDALDRLPTSRLFLVWIAMVASCALVYWLAALVKGHGLISGGEPIPADLNGLGTAIYFSFVTATSVGYGDLAPVGIARAVAISEAVAGLLLFGAVVSKFVSRRQDELVREIHRITFEERLDRVQRSLHLVLSELQTIADACEQGMVRTDRLGLRLESAALVFAGELRATHDLLYRPRSAPPEAVLGAILASLEAALRALGEVLTCLPVGFRRTPTLADAVLLIARLSDEICGDCVPHDYAPGVRVWMDRIQVTARGLS